MKLKATILSLVSVLLVGAVGIGLYCTWPAIHGTITDEKYYTAEDLQNSYDLGYQTGCKTETELVGQVKYYKDIVDEYYAEVNTLNGEINFLSNNSQALKEQINQLQNSGEAQETTIANLQNIVASNQIVVDELNNQIYLLKKNIKYYEQIIANIELENQVVATFEFNGIICNVQLLGYNAIAADPNPESTADAIFNGWTVDGEVVDLSTYHITKNTRFVADVIYRYTVTFIANGETFANQIVTQGEAPTILTTTPIKSGYEFVGWSIDGNTVIDWSDIIVNENLTLYAVFSIPTWEEVTFNGYSDYFNSGIWSDGTNTYYSSYRNHYIFNEATLSWEPKTWYGLVSFSGSDLWSDGVDVYYSYYYYSTRDEIISNRQYVLNRETDTWVEMTWNGFNYIDAEDVWSDGDNIYYYGVFWPGAGGPYAVDYKLNRETRTWEKISNPGLSTGCWATSMDNIWSDGENLYYSSIPSSENYHLMFDRTTEKWVSTEWNIAMIGSMVWSDGINIYYSYNELQYVLDKTTNTWVEQLWGTGNFQGSIVYKLGEHCYYSTCDFVDNELIYTHYQLTREYVIG